MAKFTRQWCLHFNGFLLCFLSLVTHVCDRSCLILYTSFGNLPACYYQLRVMQLHVVPAARSGVKLAVEVDVRRAFHIIIAWEWRAHTFSVSLLD